MCKNKGFCGIVMPTENSRILQFNQYKKSDKMPCIIYADIESWIRKKDECANNPGKPSTMKIGKNIPCGYSKSPIWGFDHTENKHTLYQGKDYMKKLCDSLKERTKNIINEKKKVLPLTKEKNVIKQEAKVCYICKKWIVKKFSEDENYWKVRDHFHYTGKHRGAAHSICNLKFNVLNEINVFFHRGLKYDIISSFKN